MSGEEDSTWFTIAEKLFALLVILIGAIIVYATTATPGILLPAFFAVGGLALIVVGVFMFLAKTK